MAVKEKSEAEEMEWSAEEQVQLFLALGGLKPIGINKHFYMVCICERLSTALNRDISPDTVWAHLKKLYNLEALDKVVSLPFPQEQRDFSLPEADFGLLMTKKLMEVEEKKHSEPKTETTRSRTSTPQPQSSSKQTPTAASSKTASAAASKSNSSSKPSTSSSSKSTPQTGNKTNNTPASSKELEKRVTARLLPSSDGLKRTPKRTRGSTSIESNSSPSTTPPPMSTKRRRI
ncbi:MRG/MORF4L-binding protein [Bradysia coprophila]|uniref:MRG/MORF4L-binding protein n=1 Tax=Bradysia coprophila TaxID=38358 RepID=UPI00187D9791|nr:MRG/MORF4L-binding protein [Bradysia coprophila]XP_037049794.1 MRG/MORF4L-binding protein [Bradysia coprophila]